MRTTTLYFIGMALTMAFARGAEGQENEAATADFFESRIRPVLVDHCYECHSKSSKALQGGLRLDTPAMLRKGGESGAAIVPGNAGASLLLQALRYESLEMPPAGKLPASTIDDFARWIDAGAVDPRQEEAPPTAKGVDFSLVKTHWAFQPLRRVAPPTTSRDDWSQTAIDRFIFAAQEKVGIAPGPAADRRALIRRLHHDLTGLPPSPEEVEAFLADSSPDAYERLVDRLLASPAYGERWGRHWLDVARYADTKDLVLLYGPDRIRPYSYTYRDYVIRALNDDTPYDQFIVEQIAADRLEDLAPWRLAAMGLLTLGRLFDNNPHDIYDDQIDTVTRGFLGLTAACARCHDHKYDPIEMADYYALYGVFANSQSPIELPLLDTSGDSPERREFEAIAAPKRQALRELVQKQHQEITATARRRVADYLQRVATEKPDVTETAVFYLSLSPDDLKPQIVAAWRRYLERRASADDPVFGVWGAVASLADENFSQAASAAIAEQLARPRGTDPGQINPLVAECFASKSLLSKADLAAIYGELFRQAEESAPPAGGLEAARNQLLEVLHGDDGPFHIPLSHTYLYMARVERGEYEGKIQELDKLAVGHAGAPPRAMVLVDAPRIRECRVLVRGNPSQPGAPAPRRFLRMLSPEPPEPFRNGSGRLELAQRIASPDNPLAPRVIVNRVWMHHFGQPLVATASDFGVRSDPPSHPELLDYLVGRLIDSGWSLKSLHREILLSSVYRQAAQERPECRTIDSDNRLLWRANRRRLEMEAMRDTLLSLAGRIDRTMFGRTVDAAGDPLNRRRTVYGLVDRQDVPGMYRAFDFASPDQSAAARPLTTTPQQALFAMNSAFMLEQARALAARPEIAQASDDDAKAAAMFRIVWQRPAEKEELAAAVAFLTQDAEAAGSAPSSMSRLEQLAQMLLATSEVMFID